MDITEALEWLDGKRSMINVIPQDRFETWQVRVAQADAAMMQQAYWVVSGQRRNRMGDVESRCPECGETEPVLHCEQCGHNWCRTA